MLAEAMADIRARKMDPKLGSTLGYLGTALLRAFEVADFEQHFSFVDSIACGREPHAAELRADAPTGRRRAADPVHRLPIKANHLSGVRGNGTDTPKHFVRDVHDAYLWAIAGFEGPTR
jgi:hypothetical protein